MLSSGAPKPSPYAPHRAGLRHRDPLLLSMLYAEVVIDTTTRELGERLFTYHVPDHLRAEVFVGTQVLIPFGNQELISGYVVALHNELGTTEFGRMHERQAELGSVATLPKTRPIMEVLESEPLFDPTYVSLLHWVADYYAASIAEVIAAALPSDIGPRLKRVARLTDTSAESERGGAAVQRPPLPDPTLFKASANHLGAAEQSILRELQAAPKSKPVALKILKQRSGLSQAKFYAALSALRQSGLVVVENESESKASIKTIQTVIATGLEPSTPKQRDILSALSRSGGQCSITDLCKSAATTRATIQKMVTSGILQIVSEEVLRDPLKAHSQSPKSSIPQLTAFQQAAFDTLSNALLSHWRTAAALAPRTGGPSDPRTGGHPDPRTGGPPDPRTGGPPDPRTGGPPDPRTGGPPGPPPSSNPPAPTVPATPRTGGPPGPPPSSTPPAPTVPATPRTGGPPGPPPSSDTSPANTPWLLHGVTGSGKTEIYLRLIQQTLDSGRSALMLVPEISLTPQLAQRLVSRFGDQVAVWHSALSPGERFDTWRRLRAGAVRVLLGARSAVLAALPDLGLIILDEEHDGSYKQSSPSPRYHARSVAIERGRRENALVLLGSATPDIATYKECTESSHYVELPERVFKQALPKSTLVDMRLEFSMGNKGIFSGPLKSAITQRLARNEQIILLINRRGYASHVLCRACGYVVRCKNCSVSLVFHQNSADRTGHLVCHHCAFSTDSWEICPACQSPFIKQFGLGTQRVEEEIHDLFPDARTLRIDSDITARRGAFEEIFQSFQSGAADILIGTQIVAKGLDIERVTLVGVLAADAAFNLPDYRTVERGFQLLTQVSGRAGRGQHPGEVILQTYNLDMPALSLARKQDYKTFVTEELAARATYSYPPFSQIIRIVLSSENPYQLQSISEELAEHLSTHLDESFTEDQIKLLGPAPCLIERIRSRYRHHIILKNLAGEAGHHSIVSFLKSKRPPPGITIAIDVDALDLI